MELSVLIPARHSADVLGATLRRLIDHLDPLVGGSFELVVVPNGETQDAIAPTLAVAERAASRDPRVRVYPCVGLRGKGAALAEAFRRSSGRYVFFTDADLPYRETFFDEALERLRAGAGLVAGCRRLPGDRHPEFTPALYASPTRQRSSLFFNAAIRALFPIRSLDTQAGIKGMTRFFADLVFERAVCRGFYLDVELFLTAREQGFTVVEIPVEPCTQDGPSTVSIAREIFAAAYWLGRIKWNHLVGHYAVPARKLARTLHEAEAKA